MAGIGQTPTSYNAYLDQTHPISEWPSDAQWIVSSFQSVPWLTSVTPSLGIPMTEQGDNADTDFQAIASGQWDAALTGAFQAFVSGGYPAFYIRPAWEMNGNWMDWSVTPQNAADFNAAFAHIANLAHNFPGATINVIWNPNGGNYAIGGMPFTQYYPGNQYVDTIGIDDYGEPVGLDTTPSAVAAGPSDVELQNLIPFAQQNGKPLAFPETGGLDGAFAANLAAVLVPAEQGGEPIALISIWDFNGPGGNLIMPPATLAAWGQALTAIEAAAGSSCSSLGSSSSGSSSGSLSSSSSGSTSSGSSSGSSTSSSGSSSGNTSSSGSSSGSASSSGGTGIAIDVPGQGTGKIYYVSNSGSDSNNGLSPSTPFATMQHAAGITNPGDVVDVMAGTYTSTEWTVIDVARSGTASAYISYQGYPAGTHPVIQLNNNNWQGITVEANYISVDGFEIIGNAKSFTAATANPSDLNDPQYNEGGIDAGNFVMGTVNHHILVTNNIIHDTSGGGIGDGYADYVTIAGNIVYNTSNWSGYAESGISATPMDSDSNTGYKTIIINNVLYNNANYELNYTNCSGTCGITDGEGIILDSSVSVGHYGGRTYIANNIVYNNGSSGIQVGPNSAHADVVNNTVYKNGTNLPQEGEITSQSSTDVNAYNNIVYSSAAETASSGFTQEDYNDFFAVSPKTIAAHDIAADPDFVNAAGNNFQLQASSPAIDKGTSTDAPADDFAGVMRPQGNGFDMGAYEYQASVSSSGSSSGSSSSGASSGSSSGNVTNGVCGTANNTTVSSAPTTGLCSTGTPTAVTTDGSSFIWQCTGSGNFNEVAGCVATIGSTSSSSGSSSGGLSSLGSDSPCGTANGSTTNTAPTTGLCDTGTASAVSGFGPWYWSCTGLANQCEAFAPPPNVISTFYVAKNGNDNWSGTLTSPNAAGSDGPFLTINRAKSAMESSGVKTTTIESGTYSIAGTTLSFDSSDAGETWIPLQYATVVIDGGGTGNIQAQGATNLTIDGLTFNNLGLNSNGIGFALSGSGYTIRWNTFTNCTDYCIGGGSAQSSLIDSNIFNGEISSNLNHPGSAFDVVNFWYGSSNNVVSHNLLENINGGGLDINDGPSDPAINNNVIDRNLLINVDNNVIDDGALYMYDESAAGTGNMITNNKVISGGNAANSTKCIYLDGSVSDVLVSGNICAESPTGAYSDEYSVFIHGGANNTIVNNILEAPQLAPFTDYWFNNQNGGYLGMVQTDSGITNGSGNSFAHNIVFSPGGWPNTLWQKDQASAPAASGNDYYSMTGASITNWGGITDSNPFHDNPDFANLAASDYTVGTNSAVYSDIGWQTLPADQGPLPNPFLSSSSSSSSGLSSGSSSGSTSSSGSSTGSSSGAASNSSSGSSSGGTANLLFESDFGGTTAMSNPPQIAGDALSASWQIVGGDDGFTWPITLFGQSSETGLQPISYGPTISWDAHNQVIDAGGAPGWQASIIQDARHDGTTGPMLHQQNFQNLLWQMPYVINPGTDVPDLYLKMWMKLPADAVANIGPNGWRSLLEWKDNMYYTPPAGYRIAFYIYTDANGNPYWYMHGDDDASTEGFWSQTNTTTPVPLNQWFMVEWAWHRTHDDTSWTWVKINGTKILEQDGGGSDPLGFYNPTAPSAPINRIFLSTMYGTQGAGEAWIDHIEIWDGVP